mmetsp:Transcript_34765/g.112016  ORF Transcript_34765/g.112016 Transcript_34765/m.112016 type:complete len:343 (+) Transcript_34765:1807-2835(+)
MQPEPPAQLRSAVQTKLFDPRPCGLGQRPSRPRPTRGFRRRCSRRPPPREAQGCAAALSHARGLCAEEEPRRPPQERRRPRGSPGDAVRAPAPRPLAQRTGPPRGGRDRVRKVDAGAAAAALGRLRQGGVHAAAPPRCCLACAPRLAGVALPQRRRRRPPGSLRGRTLGRDAAALRDRGGAAAPARVGPGPQRVGRGAAGRGARATLVHRPPPRPAAPPAPPPPFAAARADERNTRRGCALRLLRRRARAARPRPHAPDRRAVRDVGRRRAERARRAAGRGGGMRGGGRGRRRAAGRTAPDAQVARQGAAQRASPPARARTHRGRVPCGGARRRPRLCLRRR